MSGQPNITEELLRESEEAASDATHSDALSRPRKAETPAHHEVVSVETPSPTAAEDRAGHLPEGKEAFGFLVHEGEHLPVVRNELLTAYSHSDDFTHRLYWYSFTAWKNGAALPENYSQRDWDRLVEKGKAYEVKG